MTKSAFALALSLLTVLACGCGGFNFGNSMMSAAESGDVDQASGSARITVDVAVGGVVNLGGADAEADDVTLLMAFNPLSVDFCEGGDPADTRPLALNVLSGATFPALSNFETRGRSICGVRIRMTPLTASPTFDPGRRLQQSGVFLRVPALGIDRTGALAAGASTVELATNLEFSIAPAAVIRPTDDGSLRIGIDSTVWFSGVTLASAVTRSGIVYANAGTNPTLASRIGQNIEHSFSVSWSPQP